jgi:hypothetical protein
MQRHVRFLNWGNILVIAELTNDIKVLVDGTLGFAAATARSMIKLRLQAKLAIFFEFSLTYQSKHITSR